MIWERERESLAKGEPLVGWFTPAGASREVAGVLRWSADDGARLQLLNADADWGPPADEGPFTVHGELPDGGEVSMFSSWVKRHGGFDRVPLEVTSPGLGLGEMTTPRERWPLAFFSTHNFDQWRRRSGLDFSYPNRRARPQHFRVDVQPPLSDAVRVKGAAITFATRADAPVVLDSPSWTVTTNQVLKVEPDKPFTMRRATRFYANPLLALTAFAVNRPDGISREIYVHRDERRRLEIWWSGRLRGVVAWRPGRDRPLFRAEDLKDFAASIRRWWRLHERVWPALGIFGDHILEGRAYSPYRFLTLYTAAEAYSRERIGQNNLRKLRAHGRVPEPLTGSSDRALALIGSSRNYLAHGGSPSKTFSSQEIEEGVYDSTRRLEALLQAALLRDLGFTKSRATELMAQHYAGWPIPSL